MDYIRLCVNSLKFINQIAAMQSQCYNHSGRNIQSHRIAVESNAIHPIIRRSKYPRNIAAVHVKGISPAPSVGSKDSSLTCDES